MKLDKNTIIGFALLAILFFVFFWYNNKQMKANADYQQRIKDSTELVEKVKAKNDTASINAKRRMDSLANVAKAGKLIGATASTEEFTSIENDLVKITFTNKGGIIKTVALKKYKHPKKPFVILGDSTDKLGYKINTGAGQVALSTDLSFNKTEVEKLSDGSQKISYYLADSAAKQVVHEFILKPNSYVVDWTINLANANNQVTNNQLNFFWQSTTHQAEITPVYEKQVSNICFYENNEFDYIMSNLNHKFEQTTKWMSVVQQFFNTTLVAKNNFTTGEVNWERELVDTTQRIAKVDANFQMKLPVQNAVTIPMQLYYGPNDMSILKQTDIPEMERIINLGRDLYAFVRPINKYVILPIFNFFSSFNLNYGWVILLLTVFIRLVTAPLMYGSYLSGAKMKVLRPELDKIKARLGSDQQGFAMEQMKLFREAGVNPLGGCIPALLQIPIFFALYSFFNSAIALRGQSFLWSPDLSVYDSIVSWQTSILGVNHISLFTLTAVLTSFLISLYSMSTTPQQDNPALKYMPYIFPFILFFVFNNLPSALTWYYTVSNLITLLLQFVIQTYIIDHDKVLAKIEIKRKQPKQKSKWQEKLEQMQESQKKLQDLKNKGGKK